MELELKEKGREQKLSGIGNGTGTVWDGNERNTGS